MAWQCDAAPRGALYVSYALQTAPGAPQTCEQLGAQQIEVSLFVRADDVLPYDRITEPCAVSTAGLGVFAVVVDARRYERVHVRWLNSAGVAVRLCTADGNDEAERDLPAIDVSSKGVTPVSVTVTGQPGWCATPPPVDK